MLIIEGYLLRKEKHMVSFCLSACRVLGPASAASFRTLVFKAYHERGACWDVSCWHSLIVTSYHVHLTVRMGVAISPASLFPSQQLWQLWFSYSWHLLWARFTWRCQCPVHALLYQAVVSLLVDCLGNNCVLLPRAWTWSWFCIWLLLLEIKLHLFLPLACVSLSQ